MGDLRTKLYKGKCMNIPSACAVCGNTELEAVGYVTLDCKGFNPLLLDDELGLASSLGFAVEDGSMNLSRVTKQRLGGMVKTN